MEARRLRASKACQRGGRQLILVVLVGWALWVQRSAELRQLCLLFDVDMRASFHTIVKRRVGQDGLRFYRKPGLATLLY